MIRIAAYNNNFHEFTASTPLNGDYATISHNGEHEYILQPDKDGLFLFNTYEFSRELFNYKDTYDYSGDVVDGNQSITITFDIKITLLDSSEENSTLEVTFFNGVFQRWECPFVEDGVVNFSDIKMPYFRGYPFEYSEVIGNEVNRVLVDNGLGIGNNDNVREIHDECEGYYLKFHHNKYGYGYYLFQNIAIGNLKTKSIGGLKEQFSWTDNQLELGKKGQRQIDVFGNIDYRDRELMKQLADSNEVYLYTGNRYDIATTQKWLEVRIEMTVDETNKNKSFDQEVTILLPEEKTRTRI